MGEVRAALRPAWPAQDGSPHLGNFVAAANPPPLATDLIAVQECACIPRDEMLLTRSDETHITHSGDMNRRQRGPGSGLIARLGAIT